MLTISCKFLEVMKELQNIFMRQNTYCIWFFCAFHQLIFHSKASSIELLRYFELLNWKDFIVLDCLRTHGSLLQNWLQKWLPELDRVAWLDGAHWFRVLNLLICNGHATPIITDTAFIFVLWELSNYAEIIIQTTPVLGLLDATQLDCRVRQYNFG